MFRFFGLASLEVFSLSWASIEVSCCICDGFIEERDEVIRLITSIQHVAEEFA